MFQSPSISRTMPPPPTPPPSSSQQPQPQPPRTPLSSSRSHSHPHSHSHSHAHPLSQSQTSASAPSPHTPRTPRTPHTPQSASTATRTLTPRSLDSPSRQLVLELTSEVKQLRIQSIELKNLKAHERRTYYDTLDKLESEREKIYAAALDEVVERQCEIRRNAEEFLEKHCQKQEARRALKEKGERERLERVVRREAERERKRREKAEKAERAAREEKERIEAEEREKKKQLELREAAQRSVAEAKKKKEEEEAAAAKEAERIEQEKLAQQQKESEKKKPPVTAVKAGRRTEEEIRLHERYLEIHANLKKLRSWLEKEVASDRDKKREFGDLRRAIKKCAGQLTDDKKANRKPTKEVMDILKKSTTYIQPSVDIRDFIATPTQELLNAPNFQVSAIFIYLVNVLSKSVINQLISEAGVKPATAERLGVFVASIISTPDLAFHGHSMIDIVLAKYHLICPVLFGFYGREDTEEGKDALGWWREDRRQKGPFVHPSTHEERMIGLASGFAAMSLRNFSKAQRKNPLPNRYFWAAVAYIVEVPPEEVQSTHLYVLASLLRYSATRVVQFWGDFGLQMLRYVTVDWLEKVPGKSAAKSRCELLRINWVNEKGILIA